MARPEFSIPAVRGTQAGHAFYTAMCPIRLLPRLFPVGVDQTTSDAQQSFRKVNRARVREIAKNIVAHHDDFHLAAVTISVEQQVRFVAAGTARPKQVAVGDLIIPLEARLTIVDGIHRIYGLQRALKECPSLADECIAMLIHVDPDGTRRGQIFSDVKRHERSSAQSLVAFHVAEDLAAPCAVGIDVDQHGDAIVSQRRAFLQRSLESVDSVDAVNDGQPRFEWDD